MDNLDLWNKVEKTNPDHTKNANVRGNKITAIAPQRQIKSATEQFGVYGVAWGFKSIEFNYSLLDRTGIIVFHGVFFFPDGEFPITSSISAFRDNAMTKPDADFAKKVETDALTKALSKLGFNADVFMGLFDDHKYVQMMNEEFDNKEPLKNKSSQQTQEDDKPWYNEPDYQADIEGITIAIREGTPPDDVINQIAQKFKISNKYRDLIKSI